MELEFLNSSIQSLVKIHKELRLEYKEVSNLELGISLERTSKLLELEIQMDNIYKATESLREIVKSKFAT